MKFEVNKRYEAFSGSVSTFEIIKRTAKRVTYVEIDHAAIIFAADNCTSPKS